MQQQIVSSGLINLGRDGWNNRRDSCCAAACVTETFCIPFVSAATATALLPSTQLTRSHFITDPN